MRRKHLIVAAGVTLLQLITFALSSMSGPHQLEFFTFYGVCAIVLIGLAA